jgi:chromosome segregation ATPase
MNSNRAKQAQSQELAEAETPEPSAHLVAQANTILRLCEELDATHESIRAAEQAYRLAQRELAEAEQRRNQQNALAETVEEIAAANEALTAAEHEMIQQRRRLPIIESEIHKLNAEFGASVTSIMRPLRARAAQQFRDSIGEAKRARDQFAALHYAVGEPDGDRAFISVPDLESGGDLMYERASVTPEFVNRWSQIRRARRAAELTYRMR